MISAVRIMCGVTVMIRSLTSLVCFGVDKKRPRIGTMPMIGIVARESPLFSCVTPATIAVWPSWILATVVSWRLVNVGVSEKYLTAGRVNVDALLRGDGNDVFLGQVDQLAF